MCYVLQVGCTETAVTVTETSCTRTPSLICGTIMHCPRAISDLKTAKDGSFSRSLDASPDVDPDVSLARALVQDADG
jgi:hypothetical protein